MPILIETDILLALISVEDKHHAEVKKFFNESFREVKLSPYSLIELDLLLKSGEIIVKEITAFYDALSNFFKYRRIITFPIKPEYHREAFKLRKKYEGLTYFDSLHAAVGIVERIELVSYDKEYTKVKELMHSLPDKYIKM
ncbi:MAG: PIN domain-containing protein [Candidatus Bathyarchaeia archaeon]